MNIIVAPNGVALPQDVQATLQNPQLVWTLAGVLGSFVRASSQVTEPIEVPIHVVRADDVANVWAVGPWVFHASDLRSGTLGMYCEMVRKSRAKAGMAQMMGMQAPPGVVIPRYVMSLLAHDEGIPVGIIVQSTAPQPPLPMLELQLEAGVQSMWLASAHINIVARIGEPALRAALAAVATLRAAHTDFGTFIDQMPATLKPHSLVDDEAIACLVLDQWERQDGGAQRMQQLRTMVRP